MLATSHLATPCGTNTYHILVLQYAWSPHLFRNGGEQCGDNHRRVFHYVQIQGKVNNFNVVTFMVVRMRHAW